VDEKNDSIIYGNIVASKVIFCQGHENGANPYFQYLPFKQAKGEVLIIEKKDLLLDDILHNGINIVPYGEHTYWVGSTFNWSDLSTKTTSEGKETLQKQLDETIIGDYKIIKHWAGIRPTVKDRRPMLGLHNKHPQIGIFNGLGTRGVMLAPYFSNQLVQHILHRKSLDREVDIQRFNELM
jgi:glycine/D-amino acid oxidase-like deaminating enzyme